MFEIMIVDSKHSCDRNLIAHILFKISQYIIICYNAVDALI